MRILYINHYAGSHRHGMEFRPFYLAREWVRAGHEVQILAASQSHVRAVQPRLVGDFLDERIDGVAFRWYRTPAYRGNGISRVLNMLAFVRALAKDGRRLADEFKPDLVIASSTYPMDIFPARWIARRARGRLVFEVHDLWPLTPIQIGGMPKWHPFILIVQFAEDYAYRWADKVVSLLPKALDYMKTRGLDPSKFVYIPNGIDEQEWDNEEPLPLDVQVQLDAIRSRGKPVVGYAGTHGLANALDVLLDAARLLRDTAHVVMLGGGPERQRLVDRVAREGIDNVTMLPAVTKAAIPVFLKTIDIGFIGMMPQPLYQFGISHNKLMDYMMAGKLIVLSAEVGEDPVAEAGCGVTVPTGDAAAVAQAIRRLLDLPAEQRAAMGRSGRDFVLAGRTYRVLAQKFLQQTVPTNQ